jgi:hypothetical protein
MQLKTFASFEDSCSALSAYAGSYDISPKLQRLFDTAQLTLGVRYAGSLPRTTGSQGLPLQDGSQGEERCSNVGETTVGGRELSVAGYSSERGTHPAGT